MKERPILMTPENAQKVHDGVKMQTRRIVKPSPESVRGGKSVPYDGSASFLQKSIKCPYGIVGDRLWIREAWHAFIPFYGAKYYRTGITKKEEVNVGVFLDREVVYKGAGERIDKDHPNNAVGKWHPSIHMPRWACRSVVELTDIRVERVQDIKGEDCLAEGVDCNCDGGFDEGVGFGNFITLWNSIHGPDAWQRNDWVWVLVFKKV